ncbi:hypothetical protein [Rosenbergiella metrosideri]|uniref:hypothetical protein n=1 Tax=Rosenbergiella metrosideri TaxID=2921185 RepID=UPI001F4F23ED|nr:hypothetical protein [Rosenbergiella metrosideri]
MKELTVQQSQQVSGGIFGFVTTPIGAVMGLAIGSIVDAGYKVSNIKTSFKWSGLQLGAGIGAAVGIAPITAALGIGLGVVSIVKNKNSINQQKAAQTS